MTRRGDPVRPAAPLTVFATLAASALLAVGPLSSSTNADVKSLLAKPILKPGTPQQEVISFTEGRVPPLPEARTREAWEAHARVLRQRMLDEVVFRGEAARWRHHRGGVVWMETIPGGEGYRIRKLRYEALPGLWIPALLYEPLELDKLPARIPVVLNVNGHDRPQGKAADYKQIRCINQARRGMLALNVEWLGMGQLHTPEYGHYLMNQLDLCGTSGLAPFYLSMTRGLDILLDHPRADPKRVAVAGLSGGGWQTILVSALDTRVTLSDPVAGYSSVLTRTRNFSDLGDSEQAPCDMATVADYSHLTAMLAPRATLLTFNATDNCCFAAGHALPPLLAAARPVFALYGKRKNLWAHINVSPGNHNFGRDNREALYRMFGAHFFAGQGNFNAVEIDVTRDIKTREQLHVTIPSDNATFVSLARQIAEDLPREFRDSDRKARKRLAEVIRSPRLDVGATLVDESVEGDGEQALRAIRWKLRMGGEWTVPVVELVRGTPKATTILVADGGRVSATAQATRLLDKGHRVLAVDPFYLGESQISGRDFLFALLVTTVGDRPVGLQARQIQSVAQWADTQWKDRPALHAVGPRTSLASLVAAGLKAGVLSDVTTEGSYNSLKQVIDKRIGVNQAPELFCFGLLEQFDIEQLKALALRR